MSTELPDIAKRAARVAAAIEEAVTRFARKHRFAAGADLRNQAREVVRRTYVAWHDRQRKMQRVHELSQAVDDLKIEIQIADLVKAWGSRGELSAKDAAAFWDHCKADWLAHVEERRAALGKNGDAHG